MVLCRINKNYPLLSPNIPSYLELCTQGLISIDTVLDKACGGVSVCYGVLVLDFWVVLEDKNSSAEL